MRANHLILLILIALGIVGTLTLLRFGQFQNQMVLGSKSQIYRQKKIRPTTTPKPTITPTKVPTVTSKPVSSPTPTPVPIKTSAISWGTYTGWQVSDVKDFETRVGKPVNYVATFVHWGNEKDLPLDLGNLAKSRGQTLLLYWEAMDYNVTSPDDPRFSYQSILNGKWDSYLADFASQVKSFGGPVILIPFEEMNGNWYPWSVIKNGNNIASHIASYRYLRKFFDGVTNVKFGWTVNSLSEPGASATLTDYYPGDQYVDIIGVNGFNFGSPWMSFSQIFDASLMQLETINKPIMIFSTSCAPDSKKAAWITDTFGVQIPKHPKIAGWIWFNENKEKDWRVWSDPASLEAFKNILP